MGVYKYQKVEDCLNITRRSFSSKYVFFKTRCDIPLKYFFVVRFETLLCFKGIIHSSYPLPNLICSIMSYWIPTFVSSFNNETDKTGTNQIVTNKKYFDDNWNNVCSNNVHSELRLLKSKIVILKTFCFWWIFLSVSIYITSLMLYLRM